MARRGRIGKARKFREIALFQPLLGLFLLFFPLLATIPEDLNDTTSKRMTRSRSKSSVESPNSKQESKKQKIRETNSSRTNLAQQENQVIISSRKSSRTSKQLDKSLGDNPFTKVTF